MHSSPAFILNICFKAIYSTASDECCTVYSSEIVTKHNGTGLRNIFIHITEAHLKMYENLTSEFQFDIYTIYKAKLIFFNKFKSVKEVFLDNDVVLKVTKKSGNTIHGVLNFKMKKNSRFENTQYSCILVKFGANFDREIRIVSECKQISYPRSEFLIENQEILFEMRCFVDFEFAIFDFKDDDFITICDIQSSKIINFFPLKVHIKTSQISRSILEVFFRFYTDAGDLRLIIVAQNTFYCYSSKKLEQLVECLKSAKNQMPLKVGCIL